LCIAGETLELGYKIMSAYLDTPQAIKRRRAFMHALVPLIGNEKSLQAVALWEETLGSDQPLLRGIPTFVNLLVTELNLAAQPKDLSYALMQSLGSAESGLPPDPKPLLAGGGAAKASPAVGARRATDAATSQPAEPLTATLSALLLAIVDGVGRADRSAQRFAVEQFVLAAGSPVIASDIQSLLGGKTECMTGKYDEQKAAELINVLYIQVANAAGPVSADRILTQAVTQVENSPAGFRFSPRTLL
jgi:hypothetical protein